MPIDYYLEIDRIIASRMVCKSCGIRPYIIRESGDTVCSFCEAYVAGSSAHPVSDAALSAALSGMAKALSERKWEAGAEHADAIAASADPHLLFGAAAYYKAFSDSVYNDVDYTLGGFMYPNAAKRSDELAKNKNNAMALISKSKGYLFNALKVISSTHGPDASTIFIGFMACMKLGRLHQASMLKGMLDKSAPETIRRYAEMASSVTLKAPDAQARIDACFDSGIANSAYYLSRHLALSMRLDQAIKVALAYQAKTSTPNIAYFTSWLKEVASASSFGD